MSGPSVLIDTHAHLDDARFGSDLPAVLERARAADVVHIVAVATTAASSAAVQALCAAHPGLSPTAGIHPNHVAEAGPGDWDQVVKLAESGRVVGIGETGLDRHWHHTPFPQQEESFQRHLDLARRTDLPIIIHCREADADMIEHLRKAFDQHGPIKGVLHSFAGTPELAETGLAVGLHLSFSGVLTYKNAAAVREAAARTPLDRLLVETDCPYLAPVPKRGERNEPALVVHTAAVLAGVHLLAPSALAAQTTDNARRLFRLPG
jgi:TatD DNase family protein